MFALLAATVRYAPSVQGVTGVKSIPSSSFPIRMGCQTHHIDRFTIDISTDEYPGGVSLAEYHAAFLFSPLFQLEIWLQRTLIKNEIDPATLTNETLMGVAMGERSTFGPWTSWGVEGQRTHALENAGQVMRCRIRDQPFCDTYWCVEMSDDDRNAAALVFGTSMIGEFPWYAQLLLTPLHNVYSRLLLASAKARLVQEARRKQS